MKPDTGLVRAEAGPPLRGRLQGSLQPRVCSCKGRGFQRGTPANPHFSDASKRLFLTSIVLIKKLLISPWKPFSGILYADFTKPLVSMGEKDSPYSRASGAWPF